MGKRLLRPLQQGKRQLLTATQDVPDAAALAGMHEIQEHLQHRRDEVHHRDVFFVDQADEVARIPLSSRPGQHHRRTMHERPVQLPDRTIESKRRLLQHPVTGPHGDLRRHPAQAVDNPTMLVHHALGLARRTRGIDHISQMAGRRPSQGPGNVAGWLICIQGSIIK